MLWMLPLRSMSWPISCAGIHQPAIVLGHYAWQQFNSSYFYAIVLHWGSDFSENKEHTRKTSDLSLSQHSPSHPKCRLFSLHLSTEFYLQVPLNMKALHCRENHLWFNKGQGGRDSPLNSLFNQSFNFSVALYFEVFSNEEKDNK